MDTTLDVMKMMDIMLCRLDELPVGLGRAFKIKDRVIAVFRTRQGGIHAMDNHCPHQGGPLSEGMIAAGAVICPLHGFHFDLKTGACDQEGQCSVATYPCRVENQMVILEMSVE